MSTSSWLKTQAGYFFKRKAPVHIRIARGILLTTALVASVVEFSPGRSLTADEQETVQSVFNDSAPTQDIRIHQSQTADSFMNLLGNHGQAFSDKIFMHSNVYSHNFIPQYAKNNKHKENKTISADQQDKLFTFLHETAHTWQHAHCFWSMIGSTTKQALPQLFGSDHSRIENIYQYTLETNKDLLEYNIEQQASIIAEYYLLNEYNTPPIMSKNTGNADALKTLYKSVLKNFLEDPSYIKDRCSTLGRSSGPNT